ncbi:MAG: hypothetical protein LBI20_01060 [Holosporales bacterium]|nr:hypothetical protein [Holosporales bacterium]
MNRINRSSSKIYQFTFSIGIVIFEFEVVLKELEFHRGFSLPPVKARKVLILIG